MTHNRAARVLAVASGARLEEIDPPNAARAARAEADARVSARLGDARLSMITLSAVQEALAAIRAAGRSVETVNAHVRAVKAFSRWLRRDGRTKEHALEHLETTSPEADRRHVRRALSPEEAARVIRAAESGPAVEGMAGPDRAVLYAVALGTGFRADELRGLRPEAFRLAQSPPAILCKASETKNSRKAEQPIGAALAAR